MAGTLQVSESDRRRFEGKFEKSENCWRWKKGNGKHQVFKYLGRDVGAHKFSYLIHNGEVPQGLCVCHRCDTPSCVNPEHLFLATHKENMHDKIRKGRARAVTGEKHWRAKLRETDVIALRNQYRTGLVTQSALAEKYRISQSNVFTILNSKGWKHLLV